jgi:putative tryptophan/tyrosine transport system substrate-binding protein
VDLKVLEARRPAQIAPAFGAMTRAQTNALVVLPDPMFIAEAPRIAELAKTSRLPAMFHLRRFVEMGGLISYGAEYTDMFQQSAVLVAKVLGGSKAGDLPVEQPWQFALVINAKTATALGLTIPPSLLGQANQVIE